MKKYIPLFLVIGFCISLYGCDTQVSKEQGDLKTEKEQLEEEKERNEISYRKDAVLLSLKYKVDEDNVFNLLVEDQETDLKWLDFKKEIKSDPKQPSRDIDLLSKKYNISKDVIASILVDHELMRKE